MSHIHHTNRRRGRASFFTLVLVLVLFTPFVHPLTFGSTAHAQVAPLTIGALMALIDFTSDKIQSSIETASDEARAVLGELQTNLTTLKDSLNRDILATSNVLTSSLDNLTRTKLFEVQMLLNQVNDLIDQSAGRLESSALNILQQGSITVAQSANRVAEVFNNSVAVATVAGVFLIDRTTNNIMTLGSLFCLLGGLLMVIVLSFVAKLRDRFQKKLLLIVLPLFVVTGFVFTLFPGVRMQALGVAGLAQLLESLTNQPQVYGYSPSPIIVGEVSELTLFGAGLRPNGVDPTASVGGNPRTVTASGDEAIVIDLNGLPVPANPSVNVRLDYPNATNQPAIVVSMFTPTPVPQPPNLTLPTFTLSASSVEMNQQVNAFVTVQNIGGSRSSASLVRLNTGSPVTPDTRSVPALNPGESATVQLPFSYAAPGTYAVTASVDQSERELNGADNIAANPIFVTVLDRRIEQQYAGEILSRSNFPGSRGRDIISGGSTAGVDCQIKNVYVDVFEADRGSSRILATIEPGQTASLGSGLTWGIYFVESNVGTNNYRVVVNWWQDFNTVLHYRIRYITEGRSCQPPSFTVESTRR